MRGVGWWLVALLGGAALVFLALPVVALVIRAVQTRGWEGLPNSGIADALALSMVTTFVSMALTVVFGTPLAFMLARWQFPFRRVVNVLVELPIVLPPAVAGLALLMTFGRRGLLGGLLATTHITLPFSTAAVVLSQVFVSAPFFIRAAQIGFHAVPSEIEDAARVDGAGGWALFRRITLPLSAQALAAGLVLAWARALGEFGATILFAGSLQGRTQTMPLLIYNVLERDIDAAVWTGLILVALALAALVVSQWLARRGREPAILSERM